MPRSEREKVLTSSNGNGRKKAQEFAELIYKHNAELPFESFFETGMSCAHEWATPNVNKPHSQVCIECGAKCSRNGRGQIIHYELPVELDEEEKEALYYE